METIEESIPFNTKQVLREVKGMDDMMTMRLILELQKPQRTI